MTTPTNTAQLVALAEKSEAEFMFAYEDGAPEAARAELGITTRRVGGGVVLAMRNDPTGYWSKALGFGHETPVTDELVGQILDLYGAAGVAGATLQLAPSVLPEDWQAIADRHGLVAGGQIVKLGASVEGLPSTAAKTDLRIAQVEAADAKEWARVILTSFGMPSDGALAQMLTGSLNHPGFQTFAAWDGDQIVAGGNLFVDGEVGSLNTGATASTHRNRGGQSAVLEARIAAAVAAGCRWLVAEAGKPSPGESNPSLNNLIRAGLEPLYDRTNWNWKNPKA
ncbi:GNAT family N-acetyltransferase [Kribbella sp. NBC_01505]|uniref:GNAT family N-acetyltransferase n=1 Tax=Kribbella sp. NBC_01505 TaxID=2903580 RepID=UPI0038640477